MIIYWKEIERNRKMGINDVYIEKEWGGERFKQRIKCEICVKKVTSDSVWICGGKTGLVVFVKVQTKYRISYWQKHNI